jgi:hypothetical protein
MAAGCSAGKIQKVMEYLGRKYKKSGVTRNESAIV